jgi:putative (di)nucleoside polyphosphate hydrolase
MDLFRQGVVAVIRQFDGQVLIFERRDHPGSWQFPQGGIEGTETPEQALFRELKEEIGTDQIRILKKSAKTTSYRWKKKESRYVGQEHHWFLCEFINKASPDLSGADHSFRSFKWIEASQVLPHTVDWKQDSIRMGLQFLDLIK